MAARRGVFAAGSGGNDLWKTFDGLLAPPRRGGYSEGNHWDWGMREKTVARHRADAARRAGDGPSKDDLVIGLLNQLGERLVRSERERLLLQERQKRLEEEFAAQIAQIEKAALLADRIEEAIAQQQRLGRRIEKITQDKVQMIRKLERIEETVIETQDALNSKALVLLTDRNEAVRAGLPQAAAGAAAASAPARRAVLWPAAGIAAAACLLAGAGWLAGGASYLPPLPSFFSGPQDAAPAAAVPERVASSSGIDDPAALAARFDQDPDAVAAQLSMLEPGAVPEPSVPVSGPEDGGQDTKTTETAKTGSGKAQDSGRENKAAETAGKTTDKTTDKKADKTANKTDAGKQGAPAASASPAAVSTADFLKSQAAAPGPVAARVKPDGTLPALVKEVEKKAFEGIPEAQHDLAAIYTAGHGGVGIDYKKAALWFREAALGGVANAQYNLGVLYHQGLGVEKNMDTAIGWYKAAAGQGHPEAAYNLGIAYIEGVGMQYSPQQAARYFERAAESGIPEAAYNLGLIHENGLLGGQQVEKALYWYGQAAGKGGSSEAKTALEQLARAKKIGPEDLDRILGRDRAQPKPPADAGQSGEKQSGEKAAAPPPPAATPDGPGQDQAAAQTTTAKPLTGADFDSPAPGTVSAAASGAAANVAGDARGSGAGVDSATISQIQEQLMRRGLIPGPPSGRFDPVTADAIRAYQSKNSLQSTGRPSQALLVHMMAGDTSTN